MVMLRLTTPQGAGLDYTKDQLQRVEERLQPLMDSGDIRNIYAISGMNTQKNSGFMVLTLAPWSERHRTQQDIVTDINKAMAGVPALRGNVIQPTACAFVAPAAACRWRSSATITKR